MRRLVLQHKAITKAAVAIDNMARDKKIRETGEVMKCRLPEDVMVDLQDTAKRQRDRAAKLETAMLRELRKIPIYKVFLRDVFGVGPIVAAYLVAEIDIQRSEKLSQLRRFCGLAVINGRLERRAKGQKNKFNAEMRMRLYQMFSAMWKNAAKESTERPSGSTSKYLDVWTNYKHRMQHSGRYDAVRNVLREWDPELDAIDAEESECDERAAVRDESTQAERAAGKNEPSAVERKGAKAVIHATGWHKAADVFLADLYTVWRALEGLPVWPTYVEWITGYAHGGKPAMNAPTMMSVDEALAKVGDVGAQPRQQMAAE